MIVELNGKSRELPEGASVADALALLDAGRAQRGVAVAVDREVVPRGEWPDRMLRPGARIEVLTAIQGG